ncbi:tRNA:m(4)X modification enzyme TRM13 isoform X1 [Cynara cardunculus var. scolymus]|uniref:tRNA:m(4)X modification enzyme TRM13 isoform X1 n=1 Tax=Cynara cardunculus var. scolymus TaxID=59895 RepID=UPI000D630581|nr:tRNA:m(4)X modification enzyme TRM13 isoform X1 [Cynara cardunculus var. scolymus]
MESRCKFWMPKKKRFCAIPRLSNSEFCGNHSKRSDDTWVPCSIDPSHSVLESNLQTHLKRCPLLKHKNSLALQPFYKKGINGGHDHHEPDVTSESKRMAVHSMTAPQFIKLIAKIKSVHASICNHIHDSFNLPEACKIWINRSIDCFRKIPFQEKHAIQQASILGNLEKLGAFKSSTTGLSEEELYCNNSSADPSDSPAVVEFGAGRGYLTQMLADCYGVSKVFLIERKSYKLKADRSLRQKESLMLERLRIDIEDLNLNAIGSLQGLPFLAIGKHLCGPATDMTLRCCVGEHGRESKGVAATSYLRGVSIATCCHHLCQWKHYINRGFFSSLGMTKDEFHAITWFTSWAVDADHGSDDGVEKSESDEAVLGNEKVLGMLSAKERGVLGFMCKDIIDTGRLMWMRENGLESELVKYVPSNISPENHLLIGKCD